MQVDGRRIGDGKCGVRTSELQQAYAQMIEDYVSESRNEGGAVDAALA